MLHLAQAMVYLQYECNNQNIIIVRISATMICQQLLGLLYGCIVNEVMASSEHIPEANERLQKIGFKIGIKIVDEFMRDAAQQTCNKLKQLTDKFCTVGIKRFLNPTECKCEQFRYRDAGCEFKMKIAGNPLFTYVEVPTQLKNANLQYQSIVKGAIRGAFEVLQLKANITIIYENLKQKNQTIFFIELAKFLHSKEE